jgi:mono/diheme cytochrome c family protein
MRLLLRALLVIVALLVVAAATVLLYVRMTGLTAKATPPPLEASAARLVRSLAIPDAVRMRRNPVPPSDAVLAEALAHYADHCASCHGTDGSGDTEMGRGLYPPAPDMRLATTQNLTDGELFSIIENGVRFTGMPGWSTGTAAGETSTWHLVHLIRHLPTMTPDEIAGVDHMRPRSPAEVRQEIEEDEFLRGGDSPPSTPSTDSHHSGAHQ